MEAGSPPGCSLDRSDEVGDYMSISELISDLRTAFRSSDFDRVEEILVIKENKLKKKIKEMESENVQLDLELKRLREDSSEKRILRQNYEIMQERVKVAEERAREAEERGKEADERARVVEERVRGADERIRVAEERAIEVDERARVVEEKAREADERARVAEKRVMKVDEGKKLAEENSRKFEEMLERLLKDAKKSEREKVDEIAQIMEKNKVLESAKIRAEEDAEVWKKFFEGLEKRVSLLEAETEIYLKMDSLVPRVTATCSSESNKANGEKGAGKNDGFAVVSGSAHLPSSSTVSRNQDLSSDKKSAFEQQAIVIIDSDDENAPPGSSLHDKEFSRKLPDKDPIDLMDWDIKPIPLCKRKRPWSPNVSESKMKLDGSTINNMSATSTNDAENLKTPSKHDQVKCEEKTVGEISSPTILNKLMVDDEADAFKFEVSTSSDSDGSIDLDEIILESQRLI
ncbi:uncharacterized protein LOC133778562 [Humulus lupulus]|uniref:uncharacterized protein LOC133778562 n=1 Tax=Humulus lupulus TaxID=3486 RepID=UPI002B40BFD5|nr:uncharacterized protein LOC133778562 [Humulus lupulus]XP_062074514.1 uncharacterized protein LOC133778562 [Humulus lupulus]XP_062074515.1 uncharacterized protein LOC133778562 [Humulus lupulus]XP_062074516.1 uncharacterized protein LOC133778562 [Humulus lupulus]